MTPDTNMDAVEEVLDDLPDASAPNGNGKKPRNGPPHGNKRDESDVPTQQGRADDKSISEYFQSIAGSAPVQIKIRRIHPRFHEGVQVAGLLDTVDYFITEEEIRERWKGGKYEVQCHRRNPSGKMVFAGQRTIEIAGHPALPQEGNMAAPQIVEVTKEDASVQREAMKMAERVAETANERADRLEKEMSDLRLQLARPGTDPMLIKLFDGMMTRLNAPPPPPPDNSANTNLIEKLVTRSEDALAPLRAAHEAELRSVRETAERALQNAEARFDRQLDAATRQHEQTIAMLNASHAREVDNLKTTYDQRLRQLEGDNARLARENDKLSTALEQERGKRDKPVEERFAELFGLMKLMDEMRGKDDRDEDAESTIWEKILDKAGPLVEGIGARLGQAPGPVVDPRAARLAQMPRRRGPIRRTPTGPVQGTTPPAATQAPPQVPAPRPPQAQAQRPPTGAPPAQPAPETLVIPEAQIQEVVAFAETALNNDTSPEEFASTALSMGAVDKKLIMALQQEGVVDKLLERVAELKPSSPLTTMNGRNFVRKVVLILSSTLR